MLIRGTRNTVNSCLSHTYSAVLENDIGNVHEPKHTCVDGCKRFFFPVSETTYVRLQAYQSVENQSDILDRYFWNGLVFVDNLREDNQQAETQESIALAYIDDHSDAAPDP